MDNSPAIKRLFRNFGKVHLFILLGFYFLFFVLCSNLYVITGPFTGAIARHFQSCCLQFSLTIFPYSALILGAGVLMQIVPLPVPRFERGIRLTLWCIGLLGWFGGAFVSLLHALS